MTKREDFLIFCAKHVGIPYIWGGSDPKKGLDCSGLVQILLENLYLDPSGDQTAQGLMNFFSLDDNSERQSPFPPDLGDLVFFGKENATHVGLCLGNGLMIEAAGGDSSCTTIEIARIKDAKVKISPYNRRKDIITILRPKGLPW